MVYNQAFLATHALLSHLKTRHCSAELLACELHTSMCGRQSAKVPRETVAVPVCVSVCVCVTMYEPEKLAVTASTGAGNRCSLGFRNLQQLLMMC